MNARKGSSVLYALRTGPHKGETRPAVVTMIHDDGLCVLQVFTAGVADGPEYTSGIFCADNVAYSAGAEPGTWCWDAEVS